MTIKKEKKGNCLTLTLEGRLDTTTAPELDNEIKGKLDGIETLVFDVKDLDYVSSAGLRIFLSVQKTMNKQGKMIVRGVNEVVREVFDVTGFSDILTIEE